MLVDGRRIVVCCSECAFRKYYSQTPAFESEKGNRTRYFMYKMTIDEEDIRTISNAPYNVGVPYFIK
jgi:hypothetical protein